MQTLNKFVQYAINQIVLSAIFHSVLVVQMDIFYN
jgi:hypothetical protein